VNCNATTTTTDTTNTDGGTAASSDRQQVFNNGAAINATVFTLYAAMQVQIFHTPSYNETDITAGGFGLSYNGRSADATRSELGARSEAFTLLRALQGSAASL
jgi:hypothetical protein